MTLRATGPGSVRVIPDSNPASLRTFLDNFDHDGDRPKPEHTKWLRDNVFRRLANGEHAGKTFVFGPPVPALTFPPSLKRGAFLTSNRSFDTSVTRTPAHFKMHTDMVFDFTKSPPTLSWNDVRLSERPCAGRVYGRFWCPPR